MDTFDLIVEVTGLCVLAPYEQGRERRLHVLMPETGGPLGQQPPSPPFHLQPLHFCTLSFAQRYLSPTGGSGAGEGGSHGDQEPPPVEYDLRDLFLDLTHVGGKGDQVAIPAGAPVAPLHEVTDEDIDAEQVGPNPRKSIAARVTLPPWSEVAYSKGTIWNWMSLHEKPLTYQVTFTIQGVPGDRLEWSLGGLRRRPGGKGPVLYPHREPDGRGAIRLHVGHVPLMDDPKNIPPGWPAHHFAAYYTVFEPPVSPDEPVPRYAGSGSVGSFFTCLLSTVPAE